MSMDVIKKLDGSFEVVFTPDVMSGDGTINHSFPLGANYVQEIEHNGQLLKSVSDLKTEYILSEFDGIVSKLRELIEKKNKDYGDAWRIYRTTTLHDIIRGKLHRVENLDKAADVNFESVIDSYQDIINYVILEMIRRNEGEGS